MKKPTVLALLPSLALAGSLMPAVAMADVSIMYPEFITALVKPGIEAYEANTGIKVNAVKMPTVGYEQRVAVDLAAGTAPDIVVMDSFMVAELASANYLHPLDAQLKGWDRYKYYIKSLLSVASYDDKVYALPTDTDVRMLWYDKSVMKKAGIALPWSPKSWDDVLAASRKRSKRKACLTHLYCQLGRSEPKLPQCRGSIWLCWGRIHLKMIVIVCAIEKKVNGLETAQHYVVR